MKDVALAFLIGVVFGSVLSTAVCTWEFGKKIKSLERNDKFVLEVSRRALEQSKAVTKKPILPDPYRTALR